MLSQFNNLPGIYTFKDDGNLRIIDSIPGDVTVVLGTAPAGPLNLYLVSDTATAESLFDPNRDYTGTLIKGMYEAIEGGAQYVALLRIGAAPAAVDFLNGYTIVTQKSDSTAGSEYKVYYNYDSATDTEVLRIYDAATGTILYDSYTGVDNGEVFVYGSAQFTDDLTIGVDNNLASCPSLADLLDFTNADYDIGAGGEITTVSGGATATYAGSEIKAGMVVEIDTGADAGYYLVDFVEDDGTIHFASELTYASGARVQSVVSFSASAASTTTLKPRFISANLGTSLTYNQLHTALGRAYWELEDAKVDMVIPTGVYMDTPNVVDNEGRLPYEANYAAPSGSAFLGKVYEFEHAGQLFFAYKNGFSASTDKIASEIPSAYEVGVDGDIAAIWSSGKFSFDTALEGTADPAEADSTVQDISYNECNFGHQLAKFLHELSVNDNEASGVIAMKPPVNFSKQAISQWLGKSPTLNLDGTISRSGSGVLGYKLMSGSVNVDKGIFATTSGYIDGTHLTDRNSMDIDIGRYIDVVANPLVVRSSYGGSSTGVISPGAGVYGGLVMSLAPNVPATNKTFKSRISNPMPLAKKYLDTLVGTRYVCFTNTVAGDVKVVDAPTAALPTSDWVRRSTNRIASNIIERVRAVAEKFIGSVTSQARRDSLEAELNSLLQRLQESQNQYLLAGQATVKATRTMELRGEAAVQLKLVTAPELRRITLYVALTK